MTVWGRQVPHPLLHNHHPIKFPISNISNTVNQLVPTGGPLTISGPRTLVIMPAKLFVNALLITTDSFFFYSEGFEKKIIILISYIVLRTGVTYAVGFKTLP
jgi:hypothetical protein